MEQIKFVSQSESEGSKSNQDIKINSSIAVNVTDIKRKIDCLEQQLDEVGKHCREIACLDEISCKESENPLPYDIRNEDVIIKQQCQPSSNIKINGINTEFMYKLSDEIKSEQSNNFQKPKSCNGNNNSERQTLMSVSNNHLTKSKKRVERQELPYTKSKLRKHKARSVYDSIDDVHYTNSFHSLANSRRSDKTPERTRYSHNKKNSKKKFTEELHLNKKFIEEAIAQCNKDARRKDNLRIDDRIDDHYHVPYKDRPSRKHRDKRVPENIDADYITDIIQKQYKPIKMFGRKESDFSQFSAPVCRDQKLALEEDIQEEFEVCSYYCGPDRHHKHSKSKRNELREMRSVCDSRLYSSNKHVRQKYGTMSVDDAYSNADMYDFVPVKERSSPKTRRKFFVDNMNQYCREVPPSPRTLRPRLNLEAQYYTELENYMAHANQFKRRLPPKHRVYDSEFVEQSETDWTSSLVLERNLSRQHKPQKFTKFRTEGKNIQERQATAPVNNLQYTQFVNEQTNTTDTSLKKTQEVEVDNDKTGKALSEIKDILQSFLTEIKKEAVATGCVKSDTSCKIQNTESNTIQDTNNKINNHPIPNNPSTKNFNTGRCDINAYLAPFTNPFCYQVMPVCPLNCPLDNGHVLPSKSFTCSHCGSTRKESLNNTCCVKNVETDCLTKTDELIKEIYKCVTLGAIEKQDHGDNCDEGLKVNKTEEVILTSRSVGEKSHHDVKVGTSLKCYSKSCEAIAPKIVGNTHADNAGTTTSYSDTLIEKLNLDTTTHSTYATDVDIENTPPDKNKGIYNTISRMLRSIKLFKKKRKDVIEELSESENVTETEATQNRPPCKEEFPDCPMRPQDCYRPPPTEALYMRQDCQRRPHDNQPPQEYQPYGYEPRPQEYQPRPRGYQPRLYEYQTESPRYPRPHECQPDYHPPYNPGVREHPTSQLDDYYRQMHSLHQSPMRDHQLHFPHSNQRPTAPPYSSYDTSYSQMPPPPFCLKEIEVKSTSTQSERKLSVFDKLKRKKKKTKPHSTYYSSSDTRCQQSSTQTPPSGNYKTSQPQNKTFVINWRNLRDKAMEDMAEKNRRSAYSFKKDIESGNRKLWKKVIKKMFNKRNPFSPRNMILKTLLAKDKSAFNASTIMKPGRF